MITTRFLMGLGAGMLAMAGTAHADAVSDVDKVKRMTMVVGSGAGYADCFSGIIPPQTDDSTAPFSVPACPGSPNDAIPATGLFSSQASLSVNAPPCENPAAYTRSVSIA